MFLTILNLIPKKFYLTIAVVIALISAYYIIRNIEFKKCRNEQLQLQQTQQIEIQKSTINVKTFQAKLTQKPSNSINIDKRIKWLRFLQTKTNPIK